MTIKNCFATVAKELKNVSDTPALDTGLFIKEICSLTDSDLYIHTDREIPPEKLEHIFSCVSKRLKGLPVAYILGHKEFYGLDFHTPANVLIPRPDTEILVETAIKTITRTCTDSISVLDLCAGTGCIGISVAHSIKSSGNTIPIKLTFSDISTDAYNCFKDNADRLLKNTGIKTVFRCGDLFEPLKGKKFNFILTNPPYIETDVIPTLKAEVRSEPILALNGGEDGLSAIRRIIELSPAFLYPQGYLFMETGFNQGEQVKKLFECNSFKDVSVIKDYGGNNRVVCGRLP